MSLSRSLIRSTALVGACLTVAVLSAAADAGTITMTRNKSTTDGYSGDNGGGENMVTQFTGADVVAMGSNVQVSGGLFQTFCLERNEFFTPGTQYEWTMSAAASNGGVGGQASAGSDPISDETAFLYTQFYYGQLQGYDYTLGTARKNSAAQLQSAIWYLEGELTSLSTTSQAWAWVQQAYEATDGDGTYDVWNRGLGGVRVLTITDATGAYKQDQLFMVPLPPAFLLGLVGLGGLGLVRTVRRRRSAR